MSKLGRWWRGARVSCSVGSAFVKAGTDPPLPLLMPPPRRQVPGFLILQPGRACNKSALHQQLLVADPIFSPDLGPFVTLHHDDLVGPSAGWSTGGRGVAMIKATVGTFHHLGGWGSARRAPGKKKPGKTSVSPYPRSKSRPTSIKGNSKSSDLCCQRAYQPVGERRKIKKKATVSVRWKSRRSALFAAQSSLNPPGQRFRIVEKRPG